MRLCGVTRYAHTATGEAGQNRRMPNQQPGNRNGIQKYQTGRPAGKTQTNHHTGSGFTPGQETQQKNVTGRRHNRSGTVLDGDKDIYMYPKTEISRRLFFAAY